METYSKPDALIPFVNEMKNFPMSLEMFELIDRPDVSFRVQFDVKKSATCVIWTFATSNVHESLVVFYVSFMHAAEEYSRQYQQIRGLKQLHVHHLGTGDIKIHGGGGA